jgi:AhpD family alkylhydroperoxidase
VTSGSGALSAHLREQIALTVGQANECGYCIAAHSAIGQKVGRLPYRPQPVTFLIV